MANIKSAKKRILVINKKTLRNKMIRSAVKTAIKKVVVACRATRQLHRQLLWLLQRLSIWHAARVYITRTTLPARSQGLQSLLIR